MKKRENVMVEYKFFIVLFQSYLMAYSISYRSSKLKLYTKKPHEQTKDKY